MKNIEILKEKIIQANEKYRNGDSIISDNEFDTLVDELEILSPDDKLLSQIGHNISDKSRKKKLPIEMASMSKVKSVDETLDWIRIKKIPQDTEFIITPKYDGLSFCVNELTNEAWTRGDGEYGQKSDEHYKFIRNKHKSPNKEYKYSYGEVMIPKQTFIDKYSIDFANPRNLMAGLINSKEISVNQLKDSVYIKYGAVETLQKDYIKKSDILDYLNKYQEIKVLYKIVNFYDLIINDYLISLFHKWSKDFEIDGLVIEVNNLNLQKELGRETSTNNPVGARAFKSPSFEQSAESEITGISWNISKNNLLKPIIHIKPVKLDGVTVSNVTGNNAKFIKDNGIGIGGVVKIVRSGMVIPKVIDVIEKVNFKMPVIDGVKIGWNENGIELISLSETDDQKIKQIISFFQILDVEQVSEGILTQLYNAGHNTVKKILLMKEADMIGLDGFGIRKAEIVYNNIQSKIKNIQLSKLQHASNLFKGLGSKKLVLLEDFDTKPTLEQIMSIDGFSEISAKSYLDGYDKFQNFIKDLPITIKKKQKVEGGDLSGKIFVFTGIRRPDLVQVIESRGGKDSSSVSKNTTYLICKDPTSTSSKMEKARNLGIKIMGVEELENLLK